MSKELISHKNSLQPYKKKNWEELMFMKFITSSFSNDMWQEPKNLLLEEELSETQFRKEIIDGYSCVSREDVAKHLNIALNYETVKARPTDFIYNVIKKPDGFHYYRVQVMPSTLPCNNSYCEELLEGI